MNKIKPYKIISDVITTLPTHDMLIIKPSLFVYKKKDEIDDIKQNGININDNNIISFFSRLPEKHFSKFLEDRELIKILINKLKRIKDQKIRINPFNLKDYDSNKSISIDELQDICKNTKELFNAYDNKNISNIPYATIWMEKKHIPLFCLKFVE